MLQCSHSSSEMKLFHLHLQKWPPLLCVCPCNPSPPHRQYQSIKLLISSVWITCMFMWTNPWVTQLTQCYNKCTEIWMHKAMGYERLFHSTLTCPELYIVIFTFLIVLLLLTLLDPSCIIACMQDDCGFHASSTFLAACPDGDLHV